MMANIKEWQAVKSMTFSKKNGSKYMDLMFHDAPLQQLYVEGKFMFLVAMMEKIDFQQLKFIILQKVHGQPYHQSYRFLYQMQQL